MDAIKLQLARIQEQLGKLSASQKMLTAALLAVMVLTLMFWGRYAGTPELEPVLSQGLSSDELLGIRDTLKGAGIAYTVDGDRVLVSAEKRFEAIAVLSAANKLPADTSNAFQDIVSKLNPLASQSTTDRMWNVAYQQVLQNVIRLYPGVKDATVIISPISERRIGQNIEPSASVAVFLKNGFKPDKKMAISIADLVSHSHAALNRARVNVSIDMVSFNLSDRNTNGVASGSDISDLEHEAETYHQRKLEQTLASYGQIYAAVRVSLDIEATITKADNITTVLKAEKQIKTESSESTTSGGSASAEPGAVPNAPLSVDSARSGATASGNTTTTEKNDTTMENLPSRQTTQTEKPAGKAVPSSASVQLSWSFFSGLLKSRAGTSAKDPTDQEVRDYFDKQHRPSILQIVKATTGIQEDTQVVVDLYNDQMTMLAAIGTDATKITGAGGGGIVGTIGGYAKEIAVGVLALLSLMMVSMMVKKGTPAPIVTAMPAVQEVEETFTIGGGEDIAGEVGEADQAMDGMELDDSAVKAQQMIDQVSTMVKENPDAAANLVKRWLNK